MVVLATIGTATILLGIIFCTERVDHYWRTRTAGPQPTNHIPPFRMSHNQCMDCGRDDEPLNLEERCIYCHEKAYIHG